jgi:aminopeptidase N
MMEMFECRAASRAWDSRFTLKGSEAQYAPDREFDTEHIALDLDLDLKKRTLSGMCRTALRAIASGAGEMVFDAVGFKIGSVKSGGRPLKFTFPVPFPGTRA